MKNNTIQPSLDAEGWGAYLVGKDCTRGRPLEPAAGIRMKGRVFLEDRSQA
jgi:hypothetical protein